MTGEARVRDLSPAVEDYLKAIYVLEEATGRPVSTNALARRLGVTTASASAMVRRLSERGLALHQPRHGVSLRPAGISAGLKVIRHHRLLETFLVRELGIPWDRIHDEAEVLEHVISDKLAALIAAKLGHPTRDPHGDPIPTADLQLRASRTVGLASLAVGARGTVIQVSDADPEILRYLGARGIGPGDHFEVVARQPFGGALSVRIGSQVHAFGRILAEAVRVELAGQQDND